MAATRTAEVAWEGDLITGSGTITRVGSAAFGPLPVSWAARTEAPGGKTSPEELLAAAHASCFAMALSADLARAGTPPESLAVSAAVTFDKRDDGWRVRTSAITVRGRVPGATADSFAEIADGTRTGCPISKALIGNVELTIEASLEG
jgi:osmotically inducible protein OsmC